MAQGGGEQEQEQEQHICLDVETQLGDDGRVQRLVSYNVSVKLRVLQTSMLLVKYSALPCSVQSSI